MGLLAGGGDLMVGGDRTPKVGFVSTGADGSGDVGLLPFIEVSDLPSIRGAGERLRFPGDLASPVFNDFIIIGDGDLLNMVCS